MIHQIRKFWDDETGPELVEWAVVTIILLVAAVVLYIAVGKALGAVICLAGTFLARSGDAPAPARPVSSPAPRIR